MLKLELEYLTYYFVNILDIFVKFFENKMEFPSRSVDWPGEKFQLDITRKPIPVLSDTYDRIFPMKLVLLLLASNIIKSMNISKSIFVNYQDFRDWDYHTNILLEPNEGVIFRPWLFHSLEEGLVQVYRLKGK